MPKFLFYIGTAFCLFLALSSAGEVARELQGGGAAFAAAQNVSGAGASRAAWAVLVTLLAGLAVSAIFLRMAALLAPRNLFGAFVGVFAVAGALAALSGLALLELRMLSLLRRATADNATFRALAEMHFAAYLLLGYFVAVSMLALRPYFRVQASRILSVLVFLPLPLFFLIVAQELFVSASAAPSPASSPGSIVFFAVMSVLFFAIAVHCVRHRHLFLEMTNLRELLDSRVDLNGRGGARPVRVAFDS
jgi:hypothetical protein